MAVLLCPAQFCVPVDYTQLLASIQSLSSSSSSSQPQHNPNVEIVATRVAPLPRTEWIKVAKQLPTQNFINANLSVRVTLDWYFDAIEKGLAELLAEVGGKGGGGGGGVEDVEICVIGHSIGGWVARAYLGGLSGCVALVLLHLVTFSSNLDGDAVYLCFAHVTHSGYLTLRICGYLNQWFL